MKKILLSAIACLSFVTTIHAQANKSVFLELGGNGGFLSVNFDSRFSKTEKGLGYRAGVGFIPALNTGNADFFFPSTPSILTVPFGINHLAGKAPNYFESGFGITYAYTSGDISSDFWGYSVDVSGSIWNFVPSIGYRYANTGKGFQFRACISPIINKGDAMFWAGVSAGYKF
jgi:hypothetical protein